VTTPSITFHGSFVPSIRAAIHAIQDADTVLLGVGPVVYGAQSRLSAARAEHVKAIKALIPWSTPRSFGA
jgi:hypothetical protein